MKKINLIILFVLFKILSAFSQSEEDNTGFKLKKLKFEEATLVSSYYTQNKAVKFVTVDGTQSVDKVSNDLFAALA